MEKLKMGRGGGRGRGGSKGGGRGSGGMKGGSKVIGYKVWNPFRSKLAAAVLGGVDNIWIVPPDLDLEVVLVEEEVVDGVLVVVEEMRVSRELSCQIHDEAKKFSYQTGVKVAVAYGGAPMHKQLLIASIDDEA
ncbi:rRNA 2'-O-methyltransferase fibrillarin-like [Papaver somniferum]|uniref:rRNA 2'-O-methyltransferase fibrillarin-like n=1 Tax=Papaver somniferum TaxID=3469 RepID=UPI000E6FC07B|nr:rRNA 2'-O-methyltransferase fibrillarin-like [Papaver somniferum]